MKILFKSRLISTDEYRLMPLVKTDVGARVMEKIEECFFYSPAFFEKHCEPRKDQENLQGLSFVEELNSTRYYVKDIGLAEICKSYKSEAEYIESSDKFEGFYYCSYLNRANHNRTRYMRNNDLVRQHLVDLTERLSETSRNIFRKLKMELDTEYEILKFLNGGLFPEA